MATTLVSRQARADLFGTPVPDDRTAWLTAPASRRRRTRTRQLATRQVQTPKGARR